MLPTVKTILYCTRLAPQSPFAFLHALALARATGAKIVALHVIETVTPSKSEFLTEPYRESAVPGEPPARDDRRAADRMRRRFAAACEREGGSELHRLVERLVVSKGHVAERILTHAREAGADLIVMGARAEGSNPDSGPLGPTVEKVVGHSPVPVLSVRAPEGYFEPGVSDI